MNAATKSRIQLFGAWCGALYIIFAIVGWGLVAGFLPPHRPGASSEVIAGIFQVHAMGIRIGMVVVMFSAFVVAPFVAVLGQFLARIEGSSGALTFAALLGGAGTMVLTFYPAIWWLVAAYRPERSQELVYLMNDMAWLQFIGGASIFWPMPLAMAIAAFCDSSSSPAFPRWSGFVTLFFLLLMLPDQILFFFHSGPFAWNGLFGLWIPLAGFGGWFFLCFYLLRKAILRERSG